MMLFSRGRRTWQSRLFCSFVEHRMLKSSQLDNYRFVPGISSLRIHFLLLFLQVPNIRDGLQTRSYVVLETVRKRKSEQPNFHSRQLRTIYYRRRLNSNSKIDAIPLHEQVFWVDSYLFFLTDGNAVVLIIVAMANEF